MQHFVVCQPPKKQERRRRRRRRRRCEEEETSKEAAYYRRSEARQSMESPELTFTLAYIVFSLCFVFTPNEFRSAGLTIQNLFSSWLGSEDVGFIQYHVRRTSITVLAHSALPLGKVTSNIHTDVKTGEYLTSCYRTEKNEN